MSIYQEALAIKDEIIANRRYLHQIPELGLDLPLTAAYVEQKLIEMGYEPKRVGEYGLTATIGKEGGKCFMIRGDMDALPVEEQADVEYKSTNGKMHACGHDCHAAMLLGAAKILKAHEAELEGQVKLMFQPAEETMEGAAMMIENGIMENPHVDAALGAHIFADSPFPTGTVYFMGAKAKFASVDWFTINITGKGCHGAMPHAGVDPLVVMSHIHTALQAINSREMNPTQSMVLTIGQMHGGQTSNVIPQEAFMSGTIRAVTNEGRALIKERMETIVSSIATAFRAEAHVEFGCGCPVLTFDEKVYKDTVAACKAAGDLPVVDMDDLGMNGSTMGSEDFASVADLVPSVYVAISGGRSEDGSCYPQHHPKAVFLDEALPSGSAAYALAAMDWLMNNK